MFVRIDHFNLDNYLVLAEMDGLMLTRCFILLNNESVLGGCVATVTFSGPCRLRVTGLADKPITRFLTTTFAKSAQ